MGPPAGMPRKVGRRDAAPAEHSGVRDRHGTHTAETERVRVLLRTRDGVVDGRGAHLPE